MRIADYSRILVTIANVYRHPFYPYAINTTNVQIHCAPVCM